MKAARSRLRFRPGPWFSSFCCTESSDGFRPRGLSHLRLGTSPPLSRVRGGPREGDFGSVFPLSIGRGKSHFPAREYCAPYLTADAARLRDLLSQFPHHYEVDDFTGAIPVPFMSGHPHPIGFLPADINLAFALKVSLAGDPIVAPHSLNPLS